MTMRSGQNPLGGNITQLQIIKRLAALTPRNKLRNVTVNFDLTCDDPKDFEEVRRQISRRGGFTREFIQHGPGGGWPSWTVEFHSVQSATAFLDHFNLLSDAELSDYEVK